MAVKNNHFEIVRLLLKAGAAYNATDLVGLLKAFRIAEEIFISYFYRKFVQYLTIIILSASTVIIMILIII